MLFEFSLCMSLTVESKNLHIYIQFQFFTTPLISCYQTFLLARQLGCILCLYQRSFLKQSFNERALIHCIRISGPKVYIHEIDSLFKQSGIFQKWMQWLLETSGWSVISIAGTIKWPTFRDGAILPLIMKTIQATQGRPQEKTFHKFLSSLIAISKQLKVPQVSVQTCWDHKDIVQHGDKKKKFPGNNKLWSKRFNWSPRQQQRWRCWRNHVPK